MSLLGLQKLQLHTVSIKPGSGSGWGLGPGPGSGWGLGSVRPLLSGLCLSPVGVS